MALPVSSIMLGVEDLGRATKFYSEGLGFAIDKETPHFVALNLGGGITLALYPWEAAAQDAGVPSEGSGFRGVSFHLNPDSREAVDEAIRNAVAAGGNVVKEAEGTQWGGYYGYFSDPDGNLWKVVTYAS